MQLMPQTAERFGVEDAYDPTQNLHGGMAYLSLLMAQYSGNVELALAAYNAGEEAVDRYEGIPPYPETQRYVSRVLSTASRYDEEWNTQTGGYTGGESTDPVFR